MKTRKTAAESYLDRIIERHTATPTIEPTTREERAEENEKAKKEQIDMVCELATIKEEKDD